MSDRAVLWQIQLDTVETELIARVMNDLGRHRHEMLQAERRPDLSRMDERELSTYTDNHVRRLIRRQPALAVKAALEMGWEVIPPPDVTDKHSTEGD